MKIVTECDGWAYGVYEDAVDVSDAEARHGQALGYFRTAAEAERWRAANTPAAVSPNIPALAAALASALTAYAEHAIILKGFAIALKGDVTLGQDGVHQVMSQSHPGEWYKIGSRCPCRASSTAPGNRCKHLFAIALVKKAKAIALTDMWAKDHSQASRDEKARQGDMVAQICSSDWRMRHGGQHEITAGR